MYTRNILLLSLAQFFSPILLCFISLKNNKNMYLNN